MFKIKRTGLYNATGRALPEAPPDPRHPKDWCVLALLVAACYADNVIAAEEEIEIDALSARARSLFRMTQETMDAYIKDYNSILHDKNSVFALVELACQKLPVEEGLPEAVFSHCVDIALSDRKLVRDEQEFLDALGDGLGLAPALRQEVMTVMRWKNAF
jgi:hypothetical protein